MKNKMKYDNRRIFCQIKTIKLISAECIGAFILPTTLDDLNETINPWQHVGHAQHLTFHGDVDHLEMSGFL